MLTRLLSKRLGNLCESKQFMKNLLYRLLFGNNLKVSGLIVLAVVALATVGCGGSEKSALSNLDTQNDSANISTSTEPVLSDDAVPSDSVVEGLVKNTTAQFAEAVNSGDFSVIRRNASPDFQSTYTADEMKTAFKSFTDNRSDVVPILQEADGLKPDFSREPSMRTEKSLDILMVIGNFPTKPENVRFDYEYVMRDGEWKLLKLIINIP